MTSTDTNSKHFYSDPLAAAWMAKHFGMRLKSARGQNMYWDGGSDFRTEKDCGVYGGECYHIHPDSLHLLVPKHGDVLMQNESAFLWGPQNGQNVKNARIIQRDGKPFHWPEVEA